MSDTVIRVENLGKKYIIGHQQQERYTALRDVLANKAKGITQLFNPKAKSENPKFEEFWALKDVSFEVKRGDRIGIIGRNGAGKSTLLKILSRITEPTEGRISIKGRVASLLEVGTGFHPELTGRENIYLNGAILGMGKVEIRRKFDEIVAFAEVERFLDTPVKRYSSGMYVRLAFAVAAHLEPEILIVDEVLAVGDAQFQKKCLGKIKDVGKEGKTVIFVSHNINTVKILCNIGILLSQGHLVEQGITEYVIDKYLLPQLSFEGFWSRKSRIPNYSGIFFKEISITNSQGILTSSIKSTESFNIIVKAEVTENINDSMIAMRVTNLEGVAVFTTTNADLKQRCLSLKKGEHTYHINIPSDFIHTGYHTIIFASMIPKKSELIEVVENEISFTIEDMINHATIFQDARLGVVTPIIEWQEV